MHDHNRTVVATARPRWTEDRVETLLLALFAEQPVQTFSPPQTARGQGRRHGMLVAVAAVCLAMIVPALSARVLETEAESHPLARWVGPLPVRSVEDIRLAAADSADTLSADDEESDTESDETAEAPVTVDEEDSAST